MSQASAARPHRPVALATLVLLATIPATAAADRIQVPGGTEALARLLGHLERADDRFASSLNRVLLARLVNDHAQWERVADRRLVSAYLSTVRELRLKFPSRVELAIESGRLPRAYLELADFFGFELRGGEWIARGEAEELELRRRVAVALDLDIRFIAYRLGRGETIVVDIPLATVEAPMSLHDWSALTGRSVTPDNALAQLVEDQRFGLLLEGLRRADSRLPTVLGPDGLRTAYRNCSLALFRYGASLQLVDGELLLPGGDPARSIWRKLVGASPAEAKPFVLKMLHEKDTRAAHFWNAMYFADPEVSRFLLDGGRKAAFLRAPLLDYVDRIFNAEVTGLLSSGRGGDYSVATLSRSLALEEKEEPLQAEPWTERHGLQQACVEEPRLRRIVKKMKAKGVTRHRFLEHLLGDETPLHGTQGLLFQPYIEIRDLFAEEPQLLTPANVLLLRRAAAYRPLLLQTLVHLPFERGELLTEYLLTAEHLDCLEPTPRRDALVLAFQGGVEWIRALARDRRLPRATLSRQLSEWSEIHREAGRDSDLYSRQSAWFRETLKQLPDSAPDAPGRGPGERRLLAALAGDSESQTFRAHGLDYNGRRAYDLADGMAAFLVSQSIAPVDLFPGIERLIDELVRSVQAREDMQMRLTVFQILALLEPLEVPPEARISGLEAPQFAHAVQHRIDLRNLIETAWRGRPHVAPADIVKTIALVRRLLARELEGLLCSLPYLRPVAELGDGRFDQPLLVLRHTVARAVDPQSTALQIFPSAWNETALVPAAFSPAGSHLAGCLTHVARVLVQHHALQLAPDRPVHTWIDVRRWLSAAMESEWPGLPPAMLRLVAGAVTAGDVLIDAAATDRDGLPPKLSSALDRIIPRRRFQDAANEGASRPLSGPSERLLAGLLLLEAESVPAHLEGARQAVTSAAARAGGNWRAALQPIGVSTPRLNGKLRPWVGSWPTYESLEREASVAALRERELLEIWISVVLYVVSRDLPAYVGYDILLRVLERIPEELALETERDWESLLRFVTTLDTPYFDRRLRECLIRGLYSVEPL